MRGDTFEENKHSLVSVLTLHDLLIENMEM